MSIQEALKLLRSELGMTQRDLAKTINKAYITVNRWENGKAFPSRENSKDIIEIAKRGNASKHCVEYLQKVMLPEYKRSRAVSKYGFPDIDRDFMFQLADDSSNAIYVIEAGTYKLLYINRKTKEMAEYYKKNNTNSEKNFELNNSVGNFKCYEYMAKRKAPCPFCPISKIVHNYYKDTYVALTSIGKTLKAHAKKAVVNGKNAYVFNVTDITEEDSERNALYELTNNVPLGVGIYHVYKDNRIVLEFMNGKLFSMIGEERKKAMQNGDNLNVCLVHKDDKAKLIKSIKEANKTDNDVNVTLRMKTSDNIYSLVHISGKLIKKGKDRDTYYCTFAFLK